MGGIPSKTVSDTSTGDCEHIHSHLPRQNRSSSVPPVRELQSGHASPQLSTRRLHVTHMVPSLTRSQQAHIEHPRRSRSRLGCAPHRTRRADGVRPRGRMLTLPKARWRELGGPARSHGRQGRRGGPRSGSRASGVAAREPRRGQPTAGCAAGSYRPTRLQRHADR